MGNLFAMEIATFVNGANKVEGKCSGTHIESCKIDITHSHGEDVSSAHLTFKVIAGKMVLDSLRCVLTP